MSVPADDLKSRSLYDRSQARGMPEPEFASDDAPVATGGSEATGAANDRYELGKISAPDALAPAIGALRRKRAFRGTNTPRGDKGVGEHVRTRFHSGLFGAGETADS